jgi:hypothetical protein
MRAVYPRSVAHFRRFGSTPESAVTVHQWPNFEPFVDFMLTIVAEPPCEPMGSILPNGAALIQLFNSRIVGNPELTSEQFLPGG